MDFPQDEKPAEIKATGIPSLLRGNSKAVAIAGGCLLAILVGFMWWKSGETHRQIKQWVQERNSPALMNFIQNQYRSSESGPNVSLAFKELKPLVTDGDLVPLEGIFYQVESGDSIALGIIQIFKSKNQSFRDVDKAVGWWIRNTSLPSNTESAMRAMLGRMPATNVHGAFLAEIGRRYSAGDKAGAIKASNRYAAVPPAPEAADLASLLTAYADAESHIPDLRAKENDLDSDILKKEVALDQYHFLTLTAFLVDRLPDLGDDVYEIATFTWTGYGLQRNETAILTCNGTTFNTKGRFTLTVKPTGMKSFERKDGGSWELPTFEEVTASEIRDKELVEWQLMALQARRSDIVKEIRKLELQMSENNDSIKKLLGWDESAINRATNSVAISQPEKRNVNPRPTAPIKPVEAPATAPQNVQTQPPPEPDSGKGGLVDFSQLKVKYQPPAPPYPALAKIAKIQGTVVVEVFIGSDGIPTSAVSKEGPPQLRPSAEGYAMQWRFEPAFLNGKPVPARFRLTIPFRLR